MDSYTFDDFDDGTAREQATEKQQQDLFDFVDTYTNNLRDVEEALSESLPKIIDPQVQPVAFDLTPKEHVNKTKTRLSINTMFLTCCCFFYMYVFFSP